VQKTSRPLWLYISLFVLVLGMTLGYSQQPSAIDHEHTKWIGEVMRSIETIKPGMSRGDLSKVSWKRVVYQRAHSVSTCTRAVLTSRSM
jgi:hypothetical protein